MRLSLITLERKEIIMTKKERKVITECTYSESPMYAHPQDKKIKELSRKMHNILKQN